jgi:hypothetical protein
LEIDKSKGQYAVKGGRTIIGRIFAYQEKTGMSIKEILKLPYVMFVIGMLDAPAIDYESKEEKEKDTLISPKDANSEINALIGALG